MSAINQVEICKNLLQKLAESESNDFRADTREMVRGFSANLSTVDLNLLKTDLQAELTQRRNQLVPGAQLTAHNRWLAVLEAAVAAISEAQQA